MDKKLSAKKPFHYSGRQPRDLRGAQKEHGAVLSGTDANREISQDYDRLNRAMTRYQSGDPAAEKLPAVADWTSFGKYASREAGEQIRTLDELEEARHGSAAAGLAMVRQNANVDSLVQSGLLAYDAAEEVHAAADLNGPQRLAGAIDRRLSALHDGLIKGNTEIHSSVAPAYQAFLQGEADGGHGLQELRRAGYTPGSAKDPQGFVSKAFADYARARELGLRAQATADPQRHAELLRKRGLEMEDGTLQLGLQEQVEILQSPDIFDNPEMRKAVASVAGTMSLRDANGRHELGSADQSWADPNARLGLAEAVHGIAVRDRAGVTRCYRVTAPEGTITRLFHDNASGARAAALNAGHPRALDEQPDGWSDLAGGVDVLTSTARLTWDQLGSCVDMFG